MSKRIERISRSENTTYRGRHRYEHWLVDNQVYFITARCRDRYPAFTTEEAKDIFWDRFDHYTNEFGFVPWVTSLIDNHYHTIGYMRVGSSLPRMMQRFHGSVAKLVNDLLPERRLKFCAMRKGANWHRIQARSRTSRMISLISVSAIVTTPVGHLRHSTRGSSWVWGCVASYSMMPSGWACRKRRSIGLCRPLSRASHLLKSRRLALVQLC